MKQTSILEAIIEDEGIYCEQKTSFRPAGAYIGAENV